jgi:hypothetical protein
LGASTLTVDALEVYLAVRHAGLAIDRGHSWTHQSTGELLDDYVRRLECFAKPPDDLLPAWALAAYRAIRKDPAPIPAVTGS